MPPRRNPAVLRLPAARRQPAAAVVPAPQPPPPAPVDTDEESVSLSIDTSLDISPDTSLDEIEPDIIVPAEIEPPSLPVNNDIILEEEERSPVNNDVVLSKIFSYLDTKTLLNCHLVNRKWSAVVPPILSCRPKPVIILSTDETEYRIRRCHRLQTFLAFQASRQAPGWRSGGVIFTEFKINFKTHPSKIVEVMQIPWAHHITSLHIEGLGPEDYEFDFMHAFLASLPKLKKLVLTLKAHHGKDLAIHEFGLSSAATHNTSFTSELKTLEVKTTGNYSNFFQWDFLGLCPILEILAIDVDRDSNRLSRFFNGIRQGYQGNSLTKLSLKYNNWITSRLPEEAITTIRSLPIVDLDLRMKSGIIQLIQALTRMGKSFRKLSICFPVYYQEEENVPNFASFLRHLHSPQYVALEELTLALINPGRNLYDPPQQLDDVHPLVGVKKLVLEYDIFQHQQNDKKFFPWIIKKIPTVFPNLAFLEIVIFSIHSFKKLLTGAKNLYLLTSLTIYASKPFNLRSDHLFGKSQRRNAYRGFISLKELTHLNITLTIKSTVTVQELCQGFSGMAALQELIVEGITVDPVADAEAIAGLKAKLRYLKLFESSD